MQNLCNEEVLRGNRLLQKSRCFIKNDPVKQELEGKYRNDSDQQLREPHRKHDFSQENKEEEVEDNKPGKDSRILINTPL